MSGDAGELVRVPPAGRKARWYFNRPFLKEAVVFLYRSLPKVAVGPDYSLR